MLLLVFESIKKSKCEILKYLHSLKRIPSFLLFWWFLRLSPSYVYAILMNCFWARILTESELFNFPYFLVFSFGFSSRFLVSCRFWLSCLILETFQTICWLMLFILFTIIQCCNESIFKLKTSRFRYFSSFFFRRTILNFNRPQNAKNKHTLEASWDGLKAEIGNYVWKNSGILRKTQNFDFFSNLVESFNWSRKIV